MVTKTIFGSPIKTLAVVKRIRVSKNLKYFQMTEQANSIEFLYKLSKEDFVYGLGETVKGLNKRGTRLVSFNTDINNHTNETESLYGSHNFLIVDGKEKFGVFIDTPAKVVFEIDYQQRGEIKIICETKDIVFYEINGKNSYEVTRQFLKMIGKSFVPPLWAFGFGQSRWGYVTQNDFEKVAEGYRSNKLPLDYIFMDIDYMDRYINFTVNTDNFPNMREFVSKMKDRNINLVPTIDAGIKIEPGNKVYEEGIKKDYFCKDKNEKYFEAYVWPGATHFVDFFKPKARRWFGKQYKFLTDLGFEGFWIDMNEPSIFSIPFKKEYFDLPLEEIKKIELYQKVEEYHNFYHTIKGKKYCHYDVHNSFGHLMNIAAGNGLRKLLKNRYLLVSRSSYIGTHRYCGIWTGDNTSTWWHLRLNVLQMPNLNMCGFIYSGADTGGFTGNCSQELLLRWMAFSVFTPLFRNHTSIETEPQECYCYENIDYFRTILNLRYKLLPYIYSEFMKARINNDMYIKPLAFEFEDDKRAKEIEDQLLVGDSIMIAPIIEEGKTTRLVYLPEKMTMVRYNKDGFYTEVMDRGEYSISANLDEVVFFIRNNKLVPVCDGGENVMECDLYNVELLGNGEEYHQYIDNGQTKRISKKNIRVITKSQK